MGKPQNKPTQREQSAAAGKLFNDFRNASINFADFVAGALKQNLTTHDVLRKGQINHDAISKARNGGPTDVPGPVREAFLRTFCSANKIQFFPRPAQVNQPKPGKKPEDYRCAA